VLRDWLGYGVWVVNVHVHVLVLVRGRGLLPVRTCVGMELGLRS
jgi:hypothetical protein